MAQFTAKVMERLPFATAVLEVLSHCCPKSMLQSIWDQHRGRCYDDVLRFPTFIDILRDALVLPDNRVNAQFVRMEADGTAPADSSNFYRKLARMPTAVSEQLLREGTRGVRRLLPELIDPLPACFASFDAIALDGKTVKYVRKQLKIARLVRSKTVGGKALVAMDLRSRLAIAMSTHVDGLVNELPLVEPLMAQLRQEIERPMLIVCDRQFDSRDCFSQFCARAEDGFVVRIRNTQTMKLSVIDSVKCTDSEDREVIDERVAVTGVAGELRRITLRRDGEDVTLMTNLTDRDRYDTAAFMSLYKARWGIENMFQQVTDRFDLKTLIGSTACATLMQLSYCLLIYNVTQLIRNWLACVGKVQASAVSMHYLFREMSHELIAWRLVCDGQWTPKPRTDEDLRTLLRTTAGKRWNPKRFPVHRDKKPRLPRRKPHRIVGDRISIHRLETGNYRLKST